MSSSLPEPRVPLDVEAEAAAELINAYSRRFPGSAPVSVEEVRRWWDVDVDRETCVRIVPGGGYLDLNPRGGFWNADLRAVDAGAAAALLDWAEATAAGHSLRVWLTATDPQTAALLESRRYRRIRSSYRMALELDAELPEPDWPEGIAVRSPLPGEERAVYEAHQEAFEDHWGYVRDEWPRWRRHHFGEHQDPTLWFLALGGPEIAGVARCGPDLAVEGQTWVHELAVRRPWRRRGLATALLLNAFRELRARGFGRVVLGVDAENTTGAVGLYERLGMHQESRHDIHELAS